MLIAGCDFPDALHYLVEHQVWARLHDDGSATVGITALGIAQAGEIYMARAKAVGAEVVQGGSVAVVELAKSIVSVKSPVSGRVVDINPLLDAEPEWVHREPYGRGWLARVQLSAFEGDRDRLAQGDALVPAVAHYAWLNGIGPAPGAA